MSAVTVKKVPVWKPIKVVYNDGTDHTVKLYGERKMEKLFQYLLGLGSLVSFTAYSRDRIVKKYV